MNRINSFSRRLTRRIVLALVLILAVITVGVFYQASRIMEFMTSAYYEHVADIENESVEKRLHDIQVAIRNSIDEVEWQLASPDSVAMALGDKLQLNPGVTIGFGAAFKPNYYPEKGPWYEPYAAWRDGKVEVSQIGSASHDYFNMEWYQGGMKTDEDYWTDPYFDDSGAQMLLCTYCVPIRDHRGRKVGVLGGDISLEMVHEYLLKKDIKANTEGPIRISRKYEGDLRQWVRSIIVSRQGYYISHPNKERILRDNFFADVTQEPDTVAERMVSDMKAGRKGSAKNVRIDGVDATVYYTPLEHTGWSLAVVLPDQRVRSVVNKFCLNLSLILLMGLLAVYVISRITIRHATRPLHFLAKSADEVAKGNFRAPLPDIRHDDEIRQLRDSFSNMQQSLSQYIDELKTTTAQKSSIESELAIARNIQMAMLPVNREDRVQKDLDEVPVDIYATLNPAKAVGGDLYDYFVKGSLLYFCIGDVSGKGVPAALIMAMARSAFRLLAESESEPGRIVSRMNDTMARDNDLSLFITMFVGVLNLDDGHLSYCNAGHKVPYVDGQPLAIVRNLPVGAMPDWEFKAQQTVLAPGSMLFLYTDGLTEAEDMEHRQFGNERMKELLQSPADQTANGSSNTAPSALISRMKTAVQTFVGETEQTDDLTMLALCYQGAARHLSLSLPCDTSQTPRLGEFMEQVSELAGLKGKDAMHLNLAVEEAVVNVMNYAYPPETDGKVDIGATIDSARLTLTITDSGQPFDPTAADPADTSTGVEERPIGGLGIHLMRRYTDSIGYERRDGQNILTLVKELISYKQ